ncbi:replication initiation protein [Clostridium sp. Marseille-Q2269]|uniref:replication initiation protein n=1 Tax=Clostridium sp. Marseille-Q2269 TaxID=2942205 RepID=UPI0020738AFE|nr:replication initiation protein [Clostridium sp. Marseille-Q2269]
MDKNYLVTKSNYFIMNCNYDLSLEEQKIILTLASMVQPNDEEFKPYLFKIADFMKLLGIETKTKYTEIPKITKELMKKVFEIQEGNKIIQTAWVSGVIYEKGTGMVTLKFNPDLKPYMLQLKEKFTQYQLANILSMKSKYSPRIYEILKCNKFKKQGYIDIEIEELRKLLKAEKIYTLYADFKRKIILQAQKELKEKTDISFEFEEIKTGRKVTSIKFLIKSNQDNKAKKERVLSLEEDKDFNYINEVKSILHEEITSLQAKQIYDAAGGNIDLIKEKYNSAEFNRKPIKNIVGWLIKAVLINYDKPIEKIKKVDRFNEFPQRSYNFEKLESQLLGWKE